MKKLLVLLVISFLIIMNQCSYSIQIKKNVEPVINKPTFKYVVKDENEFRLYTKDLDLFGIVKSTNDTTIVFNSTNSGE